MTAQADQRPNNTLTVTEIVDKDLPWKQQKRMRKRVVEAIHAKWVRADKIGNTFYINADDVAEMNGERLVYRRDGNSFRHYRISNFLANPHPFHKRSFIAKSSADDYEARLVAFGFTPTKLEGLPEE